LTCFFEKARGFFFYFQLLIMTLNDRFMVLNYFIVIFFIKNAFAFLIIKIGFVIFFWAFAFLMAFDLLWFLLFFEKARVFLACFSFINLFKSF